MRYLRVKHIEHLAQRYPDNSQTIALKSVDKLPVRQ
ncbi:hypothetical protein PEC302107_04200 [Pectobacterium araliae]|nr:hypothetical protein PEC302107_04200 [Pectobacterium carotovorum subsp. carotovorum]